MSLFGFSFSFFFCSNGVAFIPKFSLLISDGYGHGAALRFMYIQTHEGFFSFFFFLAFFVWSFIGGIISKDVDYNRA